MRSLSPLPIVLLETAGQLYNELPFLKPNSKKRYFYSTFWVEREQKMPISLLFGAYVAGATLNNIWNQLRTILFYSFIIVACLKLWTVLFQHASVTQWF